MSAEPITVLVDGATGYLGSHLAAALCRREGFRVRCLVREKAHPADVAFLESLPVEVVRADISLRPESAARLEAVFDGVGAIVHLIGSIAPGRHQSFEALHQGITNAMINYARQYAIPKMVLVTACGTRADSPSAYHRTKWLAEEALRGSGLSHAILRPSLIVGRQVGNRDSKLVKRLLELIRTRPAVPLVEGGAAKVQPVFIADLVDAIIACLDEGRQGTFEIGGGETIAMRDLVVRLGALLEIKTRVVRLAGPVAMLVAQAMEVFQEVPTLSKDQVILSLADNICQTNSLADLIGREPTPLADALSTYIPAVRADSSEGRRLDVNGK